MKMLIATFIVTVLTVTSAHGAQGDVFTAKDKPHNLSKDKANSLFKKCVKRGLSTARTDDAVKALAIICEQEVRDGCWDSGKRKSTRKLCK